MAVMTFFTQYNMESPIDMGDMLPGYQSSTEAALTDGMYNMQMLGSGLVYDGEGIAGGTVTGLTMTNAYWGSLIYTVTGASAAMNNNYYDAGYSSYNIAYKDVWGMRAEQAYWLRGADTIVGSAYEDLLNGYAGTDKLYGGNGDDILTGGQGSDTLDGGAGHDTANYSDLPFYTGYSSTTGPIPFTGVYTFTGSGNLNAGSVVVGGLAAASQTDTFRSMELLRGSKGRDSINFASSTGNQDGFQGLWGNDTIIGGDVLNGTANDGDYVDYRNLSASTLRLKVDLTNVDSTTSYATALTYFNSATAGETDYLRKVHGVIGGAGNDTVIGSAADDWFRGGAGNDSFNGGGGNDWIDYKWNPSALAITLAAPGTSQAIAAGAQGTDTIVGVENISGGLAADRLTGNSAINILRGRGGNDTLSGGAGTELDFADYKDAPGAVTVTWSSATAAKSAGADGIDTLINIEGARGSIGFGDTLAGNVGIQQLDGRDGNDTLNGGAGNDILIGGKGQDVFLFTTALAGNVDQIRDFLPVDDTIRLENAVFAKLANTGVLANGSFKILGATDASVSDDYILYNKTTGALSYDADGGADGTADAVQFAVVGVNLALTNADFVVI